MIFTRARRTHSDNMLRLGVKVQKECLGRVPATKATLPPPWRAGRCEAPGGFRKGLHIRARVVQIMGVRCEEFRYSLHARASAPRKKDCFSWVLVPSLPTPRQTGTRSENFALTKLPSLEASLIIHDCLRCGLAHFDLRAHFLHARSKHFNLLLELLDFAVLFEKLIEQDRYTRS